MQTQSLEATLTQGSHLLSKRVEAGTETSVDGQKSYLWQAFSEEDPEVRENIQCFSESGLPPSVYFSSHSSAKFMISFLFIDEWYSIMYLY